MSYTKQIVATWILTSINFQELFHMDKRDRFLAALRSEAKSNGLVFRVETWRGKGGHAMVWVGNKVTTVPSREIDPKTARKIRKALGLT